MSILPLEMDGKYNVSWGENAQETLSRRLDRPPGDAAQRARPPKGTLRAVTPDSAESGVLDYHKAMEAIRLAALESPSDSRPLRTAAIGGIPPDKRNKLVFQDPHSIQPHETGCARPPVSFHSRTRTRTLDEPTRQGSTTTKISKNRQRVGSVQSTVAPSLHDSEPRENLSSPVAHSTKASPQLQKSNSLKGGRRLLRKTSRPTSPLAVADDVPSIDSFPYPVLTDDANKILVLMKTLCGRMRGQIEYQSGNENGWKSGICYIDDIKGSLMDETNDSCPCSPPVVPDLRGCRVRPLTAKEGNARYLEVSNPNLGLEIRLVPMVIAEFDLWLAAFLCWQQVRSDVTSNTTPRLLAERRPSVQSVLSVKNSQKREFTFKDGSSKDPNIIKVAKIQVWDKGTPYSPATVIRRSSTQDLQSSSARCWRKVSCILSDNGEFKILTENDVTHISIIQLSHLSRSAIQRLDRSVLDEEFCIGIFPQYIADSTHVSLFRPVYISLESRVLFEVWFCLFRSFSVPEIYGQHLDSVSDEVGRSSPSEDYFRLEKTLAIRLVEAKLRRPPLNPATLPLGKQPTKPASDPSVGDYFAEIILDGEVRARTKTKTETRNPFWRDECEFNDLPAHRSRVSVTLKRILQPEAATHGFLSSSSVHVPSQPREIVYGTVEIPMEKLEKGKELESWYPILDQRQDKLGEMFLKIRQEEFVVLLAKDYQEVTELLHRFNTGVTLEMAQFMPTNLRKLSEILINIFQVSGYAGDWLRSLVEDEIDGIAKEEPVRRIRSSRRLGSNESSVSEREMHVRDMSKSLHGEANLLFRGNSILTQALDIHMRRLGKEYLEDVLSENILKINFLNPDCEVDPSRLSQGEDISKNWAQLIALTTEIWDNISISANKAPPAVRQILKYIRAVADDRYGAFLRTASYTSVSGFLFLRFFCPALLNPKLFGLLRDHPPAKAQRTLTLIAKSLQALANLSSFGQKEVWMEPMNKFLTSNRQSVKGYIDTVCSVPSERQTFTLPASYSTPITILARLPPTSREGFPSLPYLIDHARNFSALVKLWLEANAHRPASNVMGGDLLKFHQLCVVLQSRADQCLHRLGKEKTGDEDTAQWEELAQGLVKSTIGDSDNEQDYEQGYELGPEHRNPQDSAASLGTSPEFRSPQWAEASPATSYSSNAKHTGSMRDEDTKERKERQSFWDFGKESKENKTSKQYDLADPSQSSPPSRGPSRNSKQRGFLPGLRRKGKHEGGEREK
ncbi:RasGAP protein-like protein [Calycina marina]|uniref:RasGAP protein-like protein n=1 Tax=Calycina marina TaxID=1763456 RepID=A0A9P7Z5A1_9HELO|nr:RasGAP protein-like protein [Calycina marina]